MVHTGAETIQGRKLHIKGRKLFAEIRYIRLFWFIGYDPGAAPNVMVAYGPT